MISFITSSIFAQISLGKPAEQTVEVSIVKEGNVHVKHIVKRSISAQQLDVIEGTLSNLLVTDEDGNEKQYGTIAKEPLGITIFPTNEDVLIDYDLEDVLVLKDGRWTWDFLYQGTTIFYFPDGVDLVFANNRPAYIGNKGLSCHGCSMMLEYITDPPIILKNVGWQDQNFNVVIRTLAEVDSFWFDFLTERIFFVVSSDNDFVTVIIPLQLLPNPYYVYFNERKILGHEFLTNETHTWLNFRTATDGRVDIISVREEQVSPNLIIPEWGVEMAGRWCNDETHDSGFVGILYYFIEHKIIVLPNLKTGSFIIQDISPWIRNIACFWSDGDISDKEFVNVIKYLIKHRILEFQQIF